MDLPCLVFDVNETLLDLESVAPPFQRLFGDRDLQTIADALIAAQRS